MRHLPLVLVVLVACSKKPDDTKSSSPAPASGAAKSSSKEFDCDAILPQSLRDKYFPGGTIKNVRKPISHNAGCGVKYGGKDANLDVLCDDDASKTMKQSIAMFRDPGMKAKVEDLAIGKGGVLVEMGGHLQINVWDDDSNCVVTINEIAAGDPLDVKGLAKDLVALLPVK